MHGGALGSGAPGGEKNGRYTTGEFTQEALADRRVIAALVAECRMMVKLIDGAGR
jgi:hypothetical protein